MHWVRRLAASVAAVLLVAIVVACQNRPFSVFGRSEKVGAEDDSAAVEPVGFTLDHESAQSPDDRAYAIALDTHTYGIYLSEAGATRELAQVPVPHIYGGPPTVKASPDLALVGLIPESIGPSFQLIDAEGRLQWEIDGLFRNFSWDRAGQKIAALKWDRASSPEPSQASLVLIDRAGNESAVLAPSLDLRLGEVIGFTADGQGVLVTRALGPVGAQFDPGYALVLIDLETKEEQVILTGDYPEGQRRLTDFTLLQAAGEDVLTYVESRHPRDEHYWLVAADTTGADLSRLPITMTEPRSAVGSHAWDADLQRVAWMDRGGIWLSDLRTDPVYRGPPSPWQIDSLIGDLLWAFHPHEGFAVIDVSAITSGFPNIKER